MTDNDDHTRMIASHIYATTDHSAERKFWHPVERMHEWLCGTWYAYAHEDGFIKDHQNENIGEWFYIRRVH